MDASSRAPGELRTCFCRPTKWRVSADATSFFPEVLRYLKKEGVDVSDWDGETVSDADRETAESD
jgi:hypothetical protein